MKGRERSEEELKRVSEYVSYEYCQIARQLDRFASSELARSHVERGRISFTRPELLLDVDLDAHLRMFLSSLRAVVEFLGNERPRPDDVVASDYLPVEGDTYVVPRNDSLRKGIKMFERRAGHLTYERGQGTAVWHPLSHLRWTWDAFDGFVASLKVFEASRAEWFLETHDYVRRVTEGLEAQPAEAYLESTVGAFLFRQWFVHPTISFDPARGDGPEHVPPPRFPQLVRWRR